VLAMLPSSMGVFAAEAPRGSALASWQPVCIFSIVLVVLIAALALRGRSSEGPLFERAVVRVPRRLEHLTGIQDGRPRRCC
jgi:hypothetical protein